MHFRRAVLIAALLGPMSIHAQAPRNYGGPYAPVILMLPADARTLAMGNTGVASRDDAVLFFNPAQVAIARGFSSSFEHYSPTAAGGTLAAVTRFSSGGVAIGARTVEYELPDRVFPADRGSMLPEGPVNGASTEMSMALALVIKGVRVGGAANYAGDNIGTLRASRAAFDLGASKDMFRSTIGVSVQNLGSSMTIPCSDEPASLTHCRVISGIPPFNGNGVALTQAYLPLRTTVGIATARGVGEFDVVGTAAVYMLRADFVAPTGGLEIGYSWLDGYSVAIRGGARRPFPGETPFTGGAGFNMDRLSIDYAIEALHQTTFAGFTGSTSTRIGHRIGLRIR